MKRVSWRESIQVANNSSNRRKGLQPSKSMFKKGVEVELLRIEDMVIAITGRSKCRFKRLKYKGCPRIIPCTQTFAKGVVLIDAGRDDFIRECYQLMSVNPTVATWSRFMNLTLYIRWIDETGQEIPKEGYLAWSLIQNYMDWNLLKVKFGELKLSSFANRKLTISWLLRQNNRSQDAARLPSIGGIAAETKPHKALDLESELKPTVKALFRAYYALLKHFNDGTTPERHALYDKALVEAEAVKRQLKGKALGAHRASFKSALVNVHPNNHIVRVAMMVTYMFTGMNAKPLADMRLSNVSFREVQGGKYILDSVKGRASNQQQDNSMGFSKHAKLFIESWIVVAKRITGGGNNAYLFPYFTNDGSIISYSHTTKSPQRTINLMLGRMGLMQINPSILRKTKSDALFRVTESVYLVAMSNNNSMEVTARAYIYGTEKEHQNNLGAAMEAQHAIAKGDNIADAIRDAKYNHSDILDDYEYQGLRKNEDRSHEARTPLGVRCKDNRKGAASSIKKLLKRAGIETEESEAACTDFLDCFECSEHVFVTDVEDIWLMLSFKETLQQLQQTPAINSMPGRKYTDLYKRIECVLTAFKEKNAGNYSQALEKLKNSPHPLYSTVFSLNDLLEIF